ncbi:hypothetical protein PTSG_10843 [Salpingoeca rosetta]|uniref:Pectin acetylesterase n=1 Tax=Salpingoeca rosetta (strain ATCC 50818 / BSB-021) TaxID=946362 RepID=F2URJ2_SALR5|nr:uncharacterized protein PTSG_10843 [Salpingoeca rosetta]EGD80161.1 hypothetical protein PTSG_10843 [Salpingoeca rosetta]|eukprot:XP_004988223.1 hypothetical protein PTSG_10843 [Salpingoeca rosetta]
MMMMRRKMRAVPVVVVMVVATVVALFAVVAVSAGSDNDGVPLKLLDSPLAKCMDGTPAGYYVRPGLGVNATRFVINLEGGGECATKKACMSHLNSSLGSSNYFPKTRGSFGQYQDFDCGNNPLLCGWTMVYIPYCTQDLHSGNVTTPTASTWGLYFTGANVVRTVVEVLERDYKFKDATDVILTGQSAGGIGIWYHLDWLAQRVPHATVVGAPIAGFYFPAYPYTGPNHTSSDLADFRPQAWPGHYNLWNSVVDDSCRAHFKHEPWLCMLSNVSYDFISTQVFVTEAQTDQGFSFLSAFSAWFTGNPALSLQDDCGVMCNPTCPSS